MKKLTLFIVIVAAILSCSNVQRAVSTIGVIPLPNYVVNDKVLLAEEKNYMIFTSSQNFLNTFHITKSTPSKVVIPDFNTQSVVAVILKPTTKVMALQIDKAELSGPDLNVHYSIKDTATWSTYEQINSLAAIVPKNLNVKQVNFYNNNFKEKTLPVFIK